MYQVSNSFYAWNLSNSFWVGCMLWYTTSLAFSLAETEQLFVMLQYQFCQYIIGNLVMRLYVVCEGCGTAPGHQVVYKSQIV